MAGLALFPRRIIHFGRQEHIFIALLGLASGVVKMDINDGIIFKGAKVYGINGRKMYDTWYKMEALLLGGLDVRPLITHEFAVGDFIEAFELVLAGSREKVLLNF